jgi:glycosyltransferase involved in cell wall biosynthesis
MSRPFVSVLTPTANRRMFIHAAIRCFKAQTYPQSAMEWIILDDGEDKVKDLFDAAGLTNVRYIALDKKHPIGAKRNMLNDLAKGDICVCWDDDDYYPPERVQKAVTKLCSVPGRRVPVVGSSQLYMYYTDRDEIWSIGPYNQNHCTNGTMAYWRTYGQESRYDDTAEKAEEKKFMRDWKTPVLQLRPDETMLVLCHAFNTFDKRKLLGKGNPLLKKVPIKMRQLVKDKVLRDFYLGLAKEYKDEAQVAGVDSGAVMPVDSPAVMPVDSGAVMPLPPGLITAAEGSPEPPVETAVAVDLPTLLVEEASSS